MQAFSGMCPAGQRVRLLLGAAALLFMVAALAVATVRPRTGESAALSGSSAGSAQPAAQESGTKVFKDPPAANLFIGQPELIVVERAAGIPSTRGLGSYQIRVSYDRDAVTVEMADGPFLRSTGRTPFCLHAAGEGLVVLSCFTIGTVPGPTGEGILAALTIRPAEGLRLRAASNNGIQTLIDDITATVRLSDAKGQTIPVASVGDAAVIVRALEGDISGDCKVDVVDSQMIAGRLNTVSGMALYSPFFDLEPSIAPDGDIDVRDLQVVFGRHGSTCTAPTPAQDPPGGPLPTSTPSRTPTAAATATRTPTRTPTPTPTPCPDFDKDGLCDSVDPDDDNDGCADLQEAGPNEELGGQRNAYNFWDFYDPSRDRAVSGQDFFAILERFGSTGNPAMDPFSNPGPKPSYHTRFDRGGSAGPHPWSLAPPNGAIGGVDFFSMLAQFGHSCA